MNIRLVFFIGRTKLIKSLNYSEIEETDRNLKRYFKTQKHVNTRKN